MGSIHGHLALLPTDSHVGSLPVLMPPVGRAGCDKFQCRFFPTSVTFEIRSQLQSYTRELSLHKSVRLQICLQQAILQPVSHATAVDLLQLQTAANFFAAHAHIKKHP